MAATQSAQKESKKDKTGGRKEIKADREILGRKGGERGTSGGMDTLSQT